MKDPAVLNGAMTSATNNYLNAFSQYVDQFLIWGQWLFFSLLTINLAILFLRQAFEGDSVAEGMAKFIRKFFVIALFYTVMLHHQWLTALLDTANLMGKAFTHANIDPSSIIENGIAIANKVIAPVKSFNIFKISFGAFVILAVYLIILISFISVALELAKTLIITTAKISISTFFLGFSALEATSKIAHHTLEGILTSCVKLLGIYMVVAAGNNAISTIANSLPAYEGSFDDYWWLTSTALLFWMLARSLPDELAKLVSHFYSGSGSDTHVAAIAMSAISMAKTLSSAQTLTTAAVGGTVKGSVQGIKGAAKGASQAYGAARSEGLSKTAAVMQGAGGAVSGLKSIASPMSQHYGQLADKAASRAASSTQSGVQTPSSNAPTPSGQQTSESGVSAPSSSSLAADENISMPAAGAEASAPIESQTLPSLGNWIQKKNP